LSFGRLCRCDKLGNVICRGGCSGGEDVVVVEVVVEYANQPAVEKSKQTSVAKRSRVCKDKRRRRKNDNRGKQRALIA
jgi:hypothetical protein